MKSRQIEAFRAVARTGTVTAAAELLHISQPAVSRLLAHLELQLSLPLFSRSKGRLRLTPEGEALLREVERHFVGLDSIADAAERIARHGPGSLRVVAFPSLSSGVLPPAIADVLKAHPGTSITLDTDTTDRIAASVASGRYDVGFTAGAVSAGQPVETRAIASRQWSAVFPPGHHLADADTVTLAQLAGEKLVGFSPDMSLRAQVDQLLAKVQPAPLIALAAQTIESICALVAADCGGAIVHPFARHVALKHGLKPVTVEDGGTLELMAVVAEPPARPAFVDEFVSVVKAVDAQIENSELSALHAQPG